MQFYFLNLYLLCILMTLIVHNIFGLYSGGTNHLFRRIIYGHDKLFLKNCNSFLSSEEMKVIKYNLVLSFLHTFMQNIIVFTKCNVLFNNDEIYTQ